MRTAPPPPPADVDIDLVAVSAPPVGAPHERIASGARAEESPRPILFASSTTGCTLRERPTFYWYLTKPTDCDIEMDLVRMDASGRTSVFRKVLEGVKEPGVYSFEAGEADGKALKMDVEYQVTVTLMLSKTQNALSSGFVTRVAPLPGLAAGNDVDALAKAGIWYDAVAVASQKVNADPSDKAALRRRRGLLWAGRVFSQMNGQLDSASSKSTEETLLREFVQNETKLTK